MIELLRSLLEPMKEDGLADMRPQGSAYLEGPRLGR
ncbi:hypothetical protein DES45_10545 [Microvirga subterranea]|uniref:Uncharacterized protein n=1 Tax=Microvirga subterranea TaxID=186651 RepID=A0A370HNN9_9HYPH|nr:hypothetical protein DES45_10545 [Microvirga subterranea]